MSNRHCSSRCLIGIVAADVLIGGVVADVLIGGVVADVLIGGVVAVFDRQETRV